MTHDTDLRLKLIEICQSLIPLFRDNQNHVVSDNQRRIHWWNPSGLSSHLSGP